MKAPKRAEAEAPRRSENDTMTRSHKPTRVAIAGFGTVGRSVARLLQELAPPELRLTVILNRGIEGKRVPWIDPSRSLD
jgi:phosphoglycerate dehydrogenase-like enzyme